MYKTKQVIEAMAQLEKQGLTPFDLLSWEALIYMHTDFTSTNPLTTFAIEDEIRKALVRKACALDDESQTNYHMGLLKTLNVDLS